MTTLLFTRRLIAILFTAATLLASAECYGGRAWAQQPNINVNGFFSADKAQQGHVVQAAVVVEIPSGYHVNANRPLSKFAVPTNLKVEAPSGIRVSSIVYPRAIVRRLQASNNEQLAVYEGKAIMRFNLTIPANAETGVKDLRVKFRYQSCNDDTCFPPQTSEITLPIAVVGQNDRIKRINGNLFGGGGRRRGRS